ALLTGIAWDHINVFPTFENYLKQFEIFVDLIEPDGKLIYFDGDDYLNDIAANAKNGIQKEPYNTHPHTIESGKTFLKVDDGQIPVQIFGAHNLQNLNGAIAILKALDISEDQIYRALADFKGASKRLECVRETPEFIFYKDFAHAPSKLKATTEALKNQYPNRKLIACMELHTFSSLSKDFLPLYDGAMAAADTALVYYSPDVVAHKKLEPISEEEVHRAFGTKNLEVYTTTEHLLERIGSMDWSGKTLLMMSSGNFGGIDFEALAEELI
ncbi:MAG: peptidoglycan synthetase, partial [Flavobacteriales bacterium]|nr:peptidoglycan synthetase [Flavobacteriales bacterium]